MVQRKVDETCTAWLPAPTAAITAAEEVIEEEEAIEEIAEEEPVAEETAEEVPEEETVAEEVTEEATEEEAVVEEVAEEAPEATEEEVVAEETTEEETVAEEPTEEEAVAEPEVEPVTRAALVSMIEDKSISCKFKWSSYMQNCQPGTDFEECDFSCASAFYYLQCSCFNAEELRASFTQEKSQIE